MPVQAVDPQQLILPDDAGPVSYTHLDVYKRQAQGMADQQFQQYLDNLFRSSGQGQSAATTQAVSYTHLDVYKRQLEACSRSSQVR